MVRRRLRLSVPLTASNCRPGPYSCGYEVATESRTFRVLALPETRRHRESRQTSLKRSRLLSDLNVNTRKIAPLIDVRTLTDGRHDFDFAPSPDALDLDAESFSDIAVGASVQVGREIVVDVRAEATARLICSRTLAVFDERVSGSARLLAVEDGGDIRAEEGDLSDEPDFIVMEDGILDLTTPLRDVILLAVPLRPVAPDAVNLEIRTSFGGDEEDREHVDPRWRALQMLRPGGDRGDDETEQ